MDEARHLVVEKPDGSVAIAFNQEVPPPEPPEPPRNDKITTTTTFQIFNRISPRCACSSVYIRTCIWYKFGSLHENNRYYQFCVDSIYDGCSTY